MAGETKRIQYIVFVALLLDLLGSSRAVSPGYALMQIPSIQPHSAPV